MSDALHRIEGLGYMVAELDNQDARFSVFIALLVCCAIKLLHVTSMVISSIQQMKRVALVII